MRPIWVWVSISLILTIFLLNLDFWSGLNQGERDPNVDSDTESRFYFISTSMELSGSWSSSDPVWYDSPIYKINTSSKEVIPLSSWIENRNYSISTLQLIWSSVYYYNVDGLAYGCWMELNSSEGLPYHGIFHIYYCDPSTGELYNPYNISITYLSSGILILNGTYQLYSGEKYELTTKYAEDDKGNWINATITIVNYGLWYKNNILLNGDHPYHTDLSVSIENLNYSNGTLRSELIISNRYITTYNASILISCENIEDSIFLSMIEGSSTATITHNINVSLGPGWHTLGITVDPDNTIIENDESNNFLNVRFYVDYPPQCDFYAVPSVIPCNSSISFHPINVSDPDGTITLCKWDFGDGVSVVTEDPINVTHTYVNAGTYPVIFSVLDSNGTWTATSKNISVLDVRLEIISIEYSPIIECGIPVRLSCSTTGSNGPLNYTWSIDDGTVLYGKTVNHTFNTPGKCNVTLTVSDGFDLINRSFSVDVLPSTNETSSKPENETPTDFSNVAYALQVMEAIAVPAAVVVAVLLAAAYILRKRGRGGGKGINTPEDNGISGENGRDG